MRAQGPGIAKATSAHEPLDLDARPGLVASIVAEIDALIARHAQTELGVFVWGDSTQGGADFIRSTTGEESEALRISWKENEIECIEIEPRPNMSFSASRSVADAGTVAEAVVPMLWRYIRNGRELPTGIERFADAVSL